jgi:hypothetical protein
VRYYVYRWDSMDGCWVRLSSDEDPVIEDYSEARGLRDALGRRSHIILGFTRPAPYKVEHLEGLKQAHHHQNEEAIVCG